MRNIFQNNPRIKVTGEHKTQFKVQYRFFSFAANIFNLFTISYIILRKLVKCKPVPLFHPSSHIKSLLRVKVTVTICKENCLLQFTRWNCLLSFFSLKSQLKPQYTVKISICTEKIWLLYLVSGIPLNNCFVRTNHALSRLSVRRKRNNTCVIIIELELQLKGKNMYIIFFLHICVGLKNQLWSIS